jgi:hypothetical protein
VTNSNHISSLVIEEAPFQNTQSLKEQKYGRKLLGRLTVLAKIRNLADKPTVVTISSYFGSGATVAHISQVRASPILLFSDYYKFIYAVSGLPSVA